MQVGKTNPDLPYKYYLEGGRGGAAVERYAIIMVLLHSKKKDRTECGNYRDISLVAHAGKVLLKIVARRRSVRAREDPAGGTEWFPTEPFYHRYGVCDSSATGIGGKESNSVGVCFIDLTKAHDSLD